jgi:hypothetical protein
VGTSAVLIGDEETAIIAPFD